MRKRASCSKLVVLAVAIVVGQACTVGNSKPRVGPKSLDAIPVSNKSPEEEVRELLARGDEERPIDSELPAELEPEKDLSPSRLSDREVQHNDSPDSALEGTPQFKEESVCLNLDLKRAVEIIQSACTSAGCDTDALERLDTQVDRPALLATLRRRDLNPVVLFFETGGAGIQSILDWKFRRDQLLGLKFTLDDPENAIMFIIGKASAKGPVRANEKISERRVSTVHQFLRSEGIKCGEIRVGFLGETALELTNEDAQFYLELPEESYRASQQVLNQSVFVFIYPCRRQLLALDQR